MAALLIARQVISNLKESAIPYLIEQLRLARLSFELFGALSPSEAKSPPGEQKQDQQQQQQQQQQHHDTTHDDNDDKDEKEAGKGKPQRTISQAELESSLYRVGHSANSLLSDVTFKVWSKPR